MAHFTPGPWFALENGGDDEDPTRRFVCTKGRAQNTVAEIYRSWNHGWDPETEEANARLIAAAPDLLAALESARLMIEILPSGKPRTQALAKINAALFKATGK